MNNSVRNKVLIFIIAILLLTNMAILVYFLWLKQPEVVDRENEHRREGLSQTLKKEVGFNDQQVAAYRQLKDQQWKTMKSKFDDLRRAKDSLFYLLSVPDVSDSTVDKAADLIADRQKQLDMQAFNHFKELRKVCTPEQLPKYDTLIQRMFHRMTSTSFRKGGPPSRK